MFCWSRDSNECWSHISNCRTRPKVLISSVEQELYNSLHFPQQFLSRLLNLVSLCVLCIVIFVYWVTTYCSEGFHTGEWEDKRYYFKNFSFNFRRYWIGWQDKISLIVLRLDIFTWNQPYIPKHFYIWLSWCFLWIPHAI